MLRLERTCDLLGRRATACGLLLTLCLGGCPGSDSQDMLDGAANGSSSDGNSNSNSSGPPFLDQDGNFSFDNATALALGSQSQFSFAGEIAGRNDIDIYDLGDLSPGDRLEIDIQRTSGDLDAVAALFDSRQQIHVFNDDRTPDASNLNPLIDVVLRGPQGTYYLGIGPFPETRVSSGRYRVDLRITRGAGVPDPRPQTVFLDWNGGRNSVVENIGTFDLAPFSAVDVGFSADQTETLKDRIQQIVMDRYRGFNLILLNSDDDPEPTSPHTTIYFGGRNRQAFAISQQIDSFNADPSDNSIIFTGSFVGAFSRTPSLEDMATAIGNTVAHEIGHVLGLVHTNDCAELMDTRCGNDSLLAEQTFGLAPLDSTVFPVGFQNAVELLAWTLGLTGM